MLSEHTHDQPGLIYCSQVSMEKSGGHAMIVNGKWITKYFTCKILR